MISQSVHLQSVITSPLVAGSAIPMLNSHSNSDLHPREWQKMKHVCNLAYFYLINISPVRQVYMNFLSWLSNPVPETSQTSNCGEQCRKGYGNIAFMLVWCVNYIIISNIIVSWSLHTDLSACLLFYQELYPLADHASPTFPMVVRTQPQAVQILFWQWASSKYCWE